MSIIRQSKIEDFNKLINQKKFKKIFVITGKNSFYKSKANLFFKFEKNKILNFYFKTSQFPELDELILILKKLKYLNPILFCL